MCWCNCCLESLIPLSPHFLRFSHESCWYCCLIIFISNPFERYCNSIPLYIWSASKQAGQSKVGQILRDTVEDPWVTRWAVLAGARTLDPA